MEKEYQFLSEFAFPKHPKKSYLIKKYGEKAFTEAVERKLIIQMYDSADDPSYLISPDGKKLAATRQRKQSGILFAVAGILLLLTAGYILYANATMVYYRDGNYSDHTCTYRGSWGNQCSNSAVCKVKYFSSIDYYCSEHATHGKQIVEFAKENMNSKKGNSSSSAKPAGEGVCKSCGRQFEAGDSGGNYMNIAKTGMCKNCYNNYNSMSEFLGK